jgi:hypothetical protein
MKKVISILMTLVIVAISINPIYADNNDANETIP